MPKKKEAKPEFPFTLKEIDDLDCTYNLCLGQRSFGKTYQFLYESLKAYFKNGETAAIIRRWDTDFSGATSMRTCYDSLRLNGHQENVIKKLSHGQYEAVEYRAGNYCLVSFDDEGNAIFHADKMVARGYALNLSGKVKGSAQPTCTRILYDEFLDENGRYLKDELGALRSIVNTIVRKRTNWKVYLMGNTIDMYAPIFQDLRIADKIQGLKPGDTKIFTKKSGLKISLSLVNVNDRITVPNANDYMFDFDDEVSDMQLKGGWQIEQFPHLPEELEIRPSDIVYTFFGEYLNSLVQCEIVNIDANIFTFVHKKTTPIKDPDNDVVFTDRENAWKLNYAKFSATPNLPVYNKIKDTLARYPVFYDTNETGYVFSHLLQL